MASMAMVNLRGGFLYQHRPDLFPYGFLTDEEIALWCAWYEQRDSERKGRGNG